MRPTGQMHATETLADENDGASGPINDDFRALADWAADRAVAFRRRTALAPPRPEASPSELRALFDVGLPDEGRRGDEVLALLDRAAQEGLVRNIGPRFFGWVMGASHPVGVAADWLTAAWGQNAAIYQTSPAAAAAEEVSANWLLDLLRLPRDCSVGFATGATMASFICLATARAEVLRRIGYDLDEGGLIGAPPVTVFIGEDAHASVYSALRYLGFGRRNIVSVPSDSEGRMLPAELGTRLEGASGATIVVAQAGQINTGAFDPLREIAALAERSGAWLHVDGAFGLWARAVPELAGMCDGADLADSWAVDGHKWLQVPYESGFAIVRDASAHRRAMDISASYLGDTPADGRNPTLYGPELSRRARGFAVWAVLQALGRNGVADLVRRHCRYARLLAKSLRTVPGIHVHNDVCLNQVVVSFGSGPGGEDGVTDEVIAALGRENAVFVEGATWKGRRVMRVSIVSHETTAADVEYLANAIIRNARETGTGGRDTPRER